MGAFVSEDIISFPCSKTLNFLLFFLFNPQLLYQTQTHLLTDLWRYLWEVSISQSHLAPVQVLSTSPVLFFQLSKRSSFIYSFNPVLNKCYLPKTGFPMKCAQWSVNPFRYTITKYFCDQKYYENIAYYICLFELYNTSWHTKIIWSIAIKKKKTYLTLFNLAYPKFVWKFSFWVFFI